MKNEEPPGAEHLNQRILRMVCNDGNGMDRGLARVPAHEIQGFARFDASDIERSIPELFERQVCANPQRTALGCEKQSLSYDGLNRVSNRIAHAILRRRRDKEEPIALLFHQGPTAVAATIGALKAGKIYVPLEPNQPTSELQRFLSQCQPSLILCACETETLAESLADGVDCSLNIETMAADEPETNPGLRLPPNRACYIFYTSGTTGPQKGVFDNHRNVLHNIMRYTNSLGICGKDRLSLVQSCSFSGTVSSLFSALLNGGTICPFDLQRQGIARLANWVEREKITVFHSTPAIFEQMITKGGNFDSLRMIRLEGDRAEPRQISLFQSRFGADCVLVNGLGLTEAGIVRQYFVTSKTRVDGDTVPIGYATEGMEIHVVDSENHQVEPGSIGEIVIRSEYLARGYWQQPELTSATFVQDPVDGNLRTYRTGDLGRIRTDGVLEYVGRKGLQVKLRGQWIEPARIEGALCALESIQQALAMVHDDGAGGQQLVAYVVAEGVRPRIDSIRRRLGDTLPAVMIPSRYEFLESIPLDRNGKVDRRRLPAPGTLRRTLEQAFVAPRLHEEEIVADCFRTVLNIDRVGVQDDFLDLGGDSLLATELLVLIGKRLGVDCPAALVSRTFSVASITSRLGQGSPESTIVPIQVGDSRPPLFCIHNYSGYVLDYYRLAACLGPDRTVYGVQSRAFTLAGQQDARIEEMAAAYREEILSLQAVGPYYLCGNCFGGTVAFEIAQQLRQQGQEVALLALINTAFPGNFLDYLISRLRSPYGLRSLTRLPVKSWGPHLGRRFLNLARRATRQRAPQGKHIHVDSRQSDPHGLNVNERNIRAEAGYSPPEYDGELILICAGPPHNQRGWIGVASGGCRVIEVPVKGDPPTMPQLTLDPYVSPLAAHISELMER